MGLALPGVAAVAVGRAVRSGSAVLTTVAAVGALVLGAAATRITHSELMTARREAARDRAEQAQQYRAVTERRTAEAAAFAADMRRKIVDREEAITVLERALSGAQKRVAEQTRKLSDEARRAIAAERGRDAADARAAEAIVRLAELETELDVARAELTALKQARATRTA